MKKLWLSVAVFCALLGLCITAHADTLCIMPEDFEGSLGTFAVTKETETIAPFRGIDLRGKTDQQNANTLPAQVTVKVEKAGEYTMYAHTRDFLTQPGARYFRIGINKTLLSEIEKLGAHGYNGWNWEKAGTISLEPGIHTVKIYDTSAFYARFDMLILTSEEITLPETNEQLQKFMDSYRMKGTGVMPETYLKPNQVYRTGYFYTAANVEVFSETGSWTYVRNQWMSNGETPSKDRYLHGLSTGVQSERNAKVTFAVPKNGTYYLWIRSKDFMTDQGIRLFKAMVDGKLLEKDFGGHGVDGWAWERTEIGTLEKGYHALEIVDAYANYARFDMFAITDDVEFVPNNLKTSAYKLLVAAPFDPLSVVPDIKSPVQPEPVYGNITAFPQRPTSEHAVSLNGTYIACTGDFSQKETMISAKSVLLALGYTVVSEGEEQLSVKKGDAQYLFKEGDTFCYQGKKKVEMRAAAKVKDGTFMIPVSFLNKLKNVEASVSDKDIEITHIVWK